MYANAALDRLPTVLSRVKLWSSSNHTPRPRTDASRDIPSPESSAEIPPLLAVLSVRITSDSSNGLSPY